MARDELVSGAQPHRGNGSRRGETDFDGTRNGPGGREWPNQRFQPRIKGAPDGQETFILARSTDRREKEKAIHESFATRMEAALEQMQRSAQSGRLKDIDVANRRLGRLHQRYWRVSGAFDVTIKSIAISTGRARLSITYPTSAAATATST